jgi:hypothetical protein
MNDVGTFAAQRQLEDRPGFGAGARGLLLAHALARGVLLILV